MKRKGKLPFDPKAFLSKVNGGRTISEYRKDQIVCRQGDPADSVFYIQSGKVKKTVVSEQGKEAVVALLGTGDFFGEGCLAGRADLKSQVFHERLNGAAPVSSFGRRTASMLPAKLLICLPIQRATSTSATSTIIQGIRPSEALATLCYPLSRAQANQLFIDHVTTAAAAYVLQAYLAWVRFAPLKIIMSSFFRVRNVSSRRLLAARILPMVTTQVSPIGAPMRVYGYGIFPGLGFGTSTPHVLQLSPLD